MRFIDWFAGIGGFRRGLELAGHECVGFCEYDPYAVASYTAMHLITKEQAHYLKSLSLKQRQKEILKEEYRNGEWYAKDITEVRGADIPEADIWCGGFPCFVKGTSVITSKGIVPIEQIKEGDYVLTHTDSFRKVLCTMEHEANNIYSLKVQGSLETNVTGNHRFYVRYKSKAWNISRREWDVVWSVPEWKEVQDFNGKEFIKFPKNCLSENKYNFTENELWLIGRYVADGYLRDYQRKDKNSRAKGIIFCIGNSKKAEFEKHLNKKPAEELKGCCKYYYYDEKLFKACSDCGRGAENKIVPFYILNLPGKLLKCFLDGYMSGDGCFTNGYYKISTVSRRLVLSLAQVINKVYNVPYSIYHTPKAGKHIIEGREVSQHDVYELRFDVTAHKQDHGKVIDGDLWMPVKNIAKTDKKETVYNMEVENDNSYTANGLAAHNCQDISVAGKQSGLKGERSNLFFQFVRCLKEKEEGDRPEWVILENVKNLLSINQGWDFARVLFALGKAGYNCSWQVFNSKDHGVPQNRERVYIVGHLGGKRGRKVFPVEGTGAENSVPVKMIAHKDGYRRNTQVFEADGITEALDTAQGGGRGHHTVIPIKCGYQHGLTETDISPTLQARDYKGINNQDMACVCILVFGLDKCKNGKEKNIANTVTAREDRGVSNHNAEGTAIAIPVITPDRSVKRQNGRRFKENGDPSFTLTAQDRHGVAIEVKPEVIGGIGTKNFGKQFREGNRIYDGTKVATALKASPVGNVGGQTNLYALPVEDVYRQDDGIFVETEQGFTVYAVWYEKYNCYIAIRKLTPRECFRLQGWEDKYFNRASYFNSNSQLYKQAGNGVTVNVVKIIGERIK